MANKIKTLNRSWLVGEWKLDGNALDSAWTNNGTNTNGVYVATDRGYQSQCWQGNGSNTNISLSNYSSGWTNVTLCAWIKFTTAVTRWTIVYGQNTSWQSLWELSQDWGWTTWKLQIQLRDSAWAWWTTSAMSSNAYNDWKWHLLVWTKDSSWNVVLYIDAVQVATWNNTSNTWDIFTSNNQTRIGANANWWAPFNWNIELVKIFNRVLTLSEIQDLYKEWLRYLWWQSYWSLFDWLTAYYDFNWDAIDVVWWLTPTLSNSPILTTDSFWINNRAYWFWNSTWHNKSINYPLTLSLAWDISIEISFKLNTTPSWQVLMDYRNLNTRYTIIAIYNWFIRVDASWTSYDFNTTLNTWTWYNLTMTYTSAWAMVVYINWEQIWTWTRNTSSWWAFAAMFLANNVVNSAWLACDIEFWRVYSLTKTWNEAKLLYQISSTTYPYPF